MFNRVGDFRICLRYSLHIPALLFVEVIVATRKGQAPELMVKIEELATRENVQRKAHL